MNKLNSLLYTSVFTLLGTFYSEAYAAPNIRYENFMNAIQNSDYNYLRQNFSRNFVNLKDATGKTPLSYALENDDYVISNFLIKNGANPNLANKDGKPSYCSAQNSGNNNIRYMFTGYDFSNCSKVSNFGFNTGETFLISTGVVAIAGGIASLGSSGGGGSKNDNGNNGGNTNNNSYGKVGEVDADKLTQILESNDYSNVFTRGDGTTVSNFDDYNNVRLAYSLARGATGKVQSPSTEAPYFLPNIDTSGTPVNGRIKVAVLDSGVQANNNELSGNVTMGLNNSNLAYLDCSENPLSSGCLLQTYFQDNATPYANYDENDTSSWHGTAVSVVIAAKMDGVGVTGVAPEAEILPYRISKNDGSFASFYYIGEGFRSAADEGAVVINNSWGIPTLIPNTNTPYINASDITSRDDLYALFSDPTHSAATKDNFLDQMIYAATQKDSIFVFTTGNDGTQEPGVTTAIPLFIDEFKNSDGSYKNFIAVAAYDSDANSIASYSSRCGVAKEYCITAPGTDIVVSVFENNDLNTSFYRGVDGTSFAAPFVSGAVAAIKSLFPYMNGADITKLIFVTARDLGATGVDEVYGWGMLDLERATRPVGALIVPVDSRVDNRTYTNSMSSSVMRLSSNLANKVRSKDLNFVFVDDFNRTFNSKLNKQIEVIQDRPRAIDVLNRFANSRTEAKYFGENKNLKMFSSTTTIGEANSISNEFKLSYNMDNVNNSAYGFSFYYGNNPYSTFTDDEDKFYSAYTLSNSSNNNILNPYFRNDSKENFGINNRLFLNKKVTFNIGMAYQNYNTETKQIGFEGLKKQDMGSSMSLISGLNYKHTKDNVSTIELGFVNEKDTLFASKTSGAFGLGNNNNTYYMSYQNDKKLSDNLSFFGKANLAYTTVNNTSKSLIKNVSDLYTNSFALGVNYNLLSEKDRKSNLSFMVSQSSKIMSGNMELSLPVARDNDGNIHYRNHNINLKDKLGLEYHLAYNYEIKEDSQFNFGLVYANYNDGYKDVDEGIFLLKYKKSF